MNHREISLLVILSCLLITSGAQVKDSIQSTLLSRLTVEGYQDEVHALPDIAAVNVLAGKKTEMLLLSNDGKPSRNYFSPKINIPAIIFNYANFL